MNSYRFFQNRDCEYFPCHQGVAEEDFNCLFCYCPLYALGRDCGGHPSYDNERRIKDCSDCVIPHQRDSYEFVIDRCGELIERLQKS